MLRRVYTTIHGVTEMKLNHEWKSSLHFYDCPKNETQEFETFQRLRSEIAQTIRPMSKICLHWKEELLQVLIRQSLTKRQFVKTLKYTDGLAFFFMGFQKCFTSFLKANIQWGQYDAFNIMCLIEDMIPQNMDRKGRKSGPHWLFLQLLQKHQRPQWHEFLVPKAPMIFWEVPHKLRWQRSSHPQHSHPRSKVITILAYKDS